MKGINVHIVNAEGFTSEEQAEILRVAREKIGALLVAGNLAPELAVAIQEGKSFGIVVTGPGPMTEAEIKLTNASHSFEYEPAIPTHLTVTFSFQGGPWSHAQKYERKKEVIKFLEDLDAMRDQSAQKLPPFHAHLVTGPFQEWIINKVDVAEIADDTLIIVFRHEGDALPLKSHGWLTVEALHNPDCVLLDPDAVGPA